MKSIPIIYLLILLFNKDVIISRKKKEKKIMYNNLTGIVYNNMFKHTSTKM